MKVSVIDDTPTEWEHTFVMVIAEILKLDDSIACNTNFDHEQRPNAELQFEVTPPASFSAAPEKWSLFADANDCIIFDVSHQGDNDYKGIDLAKQFVTKTSYPLHRTWFVTNKTLDGVELLSKGADFFLDVGTSPYGTLWVLSKNNGGQIAARIYSLREVPQHRPNMWNPALGDLLNNGPIYAFMHPPQPVYGPSARIDEFVKLKGHLPEVSVLRDNQLGVKKWEDSCAAGSATNADLLGNYNSGDKLNDFLADSEKSESTWVEIARRLLGSRSLGLERLAPRDVTLREILFPRVDDADGVFWRLLQDAFITNECTLRKADNGEPMPFRVIGLSLEKNATKAVSTLSWFDHLTSGTFFKDTVKNGNKDFVAKVVYDPQSRSSTLILWHEGVGYPSAKTLTTASASGFLDGCLPFCHIFITSCCTTDGVVTVELLPGGSSRRIGRPCLVLGSDKRLDFSDLKNGTIYAFVFPTVLHLQAGASSGKAERGKA